MNIDPLIDRLQHIIDLLRAEAAFSPTRDTFRAGAQHFSDQVDLILAQRLDALDAWPTRFGASCRRNELHQLREAIRQIKITDNK